MRRIGILLAALAAALGLAAASPAQAAPDGRASPPTAAQIAAIQAALPPNAVLIPPEAKALAGSARGCPENRDCLYDSLAQWQNNSPTRSVGVAALLGNVNGLKLNDPSINFDNRTTCATNNSTSLTGFAYLGFAQYLDGSGFFWQIPSGGYSICWNGWWRDNRASHIWAYHGSSSSSVTSAPVRGTDGAALTVPIALNRAAEPTFHGCQVGDICGWDGTSYTNMITHYHLSTLKAATYGVNYSGAANRISSMANWSGHDIIACTQANGNGWCFVLDAWRTMSFAGLNRNNELEWIGYAR